MDQQFAVALQQFFGRHADLRVVESLPDDAIEGGVACYTPRKDTISVLPRAQHATEVEYYGNFFHELVHATGHPTRLNRIAIRQKCAECPVIIVQDQCFEEMVAEFGAAMLISLAGLHKAASADYVSMSLNYVSAYMEGLPPDVWEPASAQALTVARGAVRYILGDTFLSSQTS